MADKKILDRINALTDKRLILLYVLNKINMPLTLERIVYIACGNEWMNYFDLSEAIVELTESELLTAVSDAGGKTFVISAAGREALSEFMSRIPYSLRNEIEAFCESNARRIRMVSQNLSRITKSSGGEWNVRLWVEDNGAEQLSISIACPTRTYANELCNRWVDSASDIYQNIIAQLSKDIR